MDANINSLRDALEWIDRDIEEEAARDGEMSNENAIRLGVIRRTLERFPKQQTGEAKHSPTPWRAKYYAGPGLF